MITGYCAVTADILHVGHIKFLKACRKKCDRLIVGVMTDECVKKYKGSKPVIPFEQRSEIVKSLSMVYDIRRQPTYEFPPWVDMFDIIFDSMSHMRSGAHCFIEYDNRTSSTKIKQRIKAFWHGSKNNHR